MIDKEVPHRGASFLFKGKLQKRPPSEKVAFCKI